MRSRPRCRPVTDSLGQRPLASPTLASTLSALWHEGPLTEREEGTVRRILTSVRRSSALSHPSLTREQDQQAVSPEECRAIARHLVRARAAAAPLGEPQYDDRFEPFVASYSEVREAVQGWLLAAVLASRCSACFSLHAYFSLHCLLTSAAEPGHEPVSDQVAEAGNDAGSVAI